MSGGDMAGTTIGIIVACLMLALGLAWLLLPFLLLSKLNDQTMRAEAAARAAQAAAVRHEQALAQVVEHTRATAEACAALTQWAERGAGGGK